MEGDIMKRLLLSIVCLTAIIPCVTPHDNTPVILPRGGGKNIEL